MIGREMRLFMQKFREQREGDQNSTSQEQRVCKEEVPGPNLREQLGSVEGGNIRIAKPVVTSNHLRQSTRFD
jgi:hypothetical protein